MTCRPGLHTCGALGIAAVGRMDLAARMAADCEERMMDEELVYLVRDKVYALTDKSQSYCEVVARAVIPIIAAHEREQCARVAQDKQAGGSEAYNAACRGIANAIRARGDA